MGGSTTNLVGHSHLVGESGVRTPFGGSARMRFFQHLVDLFEGKTLGFRNEEIGEEQAETASGSPDEEDFGT